MLLLVFSTLALALLLALSTGRKTARRRFHLLVAAMLTALLTAAVFVAGFVGRDPVAIAAEEEVVALRRALTETRMLLSEIQRERENTIEVARAVLAVERALMRFNGAAARLSVWASSLRPDNQTRLSQLGVEVGNVFTDFRRFQPDQFRFNGQVVEWQAPVGPVRIAIGAGLLRPAMTAQDAVKFTFGTRF